MTGSEIEVGKSPIVGAWHTGFQVADLERSLTFYRDLLGLEIVWERSISDDYIRTLVGYPTVELHQALLRIPGTDHCLELLDYRNVEREVIDPRTANPGTAHICFFVNGLMQIYERLLGAGVDFVSAPVVPTIGPNKGRLVVYLCDWDGIRVEMVQVELASEADLELIEGQGTVEPS